MNKEIKFERDGAVYRFNLDDVFTPLTAEGKRARLTFTKNDLEALHLCICTQIISDSEVLNDIKHEYWRQQFAKCLDGLYDLAERIDKALRGVKGEDQKAD